MKLLCCLRLFILFSLELFFHFLQSLYTVLSQETGRFLGCFSTMEKALLYLEQENTLCHVTQAQQQVRDSRQKSTVSSEESIHVVIFVLFCYKLQCNLSVPFKISALGCLQIQRAHSGGSCLANTECICLVLLDGCVCLTVLPKGHLSKLSKSITK